MRGCVRRLSAGVRNPNRAVSDPMRITSDPLAHAWTDKTYAPSVQHWLMIDFDGADASSLDPVIEELEGFVAVLRATRRQIKDRGRTR